MTYQHNLLQGINYYLIMTKLQYLHDLTIIKHSDSITCKYSACSLGYYSDPFLDDLFRKNILRLFIQIKP